MVNIVSVEELLQSHAKSPKDAIVAVDPDTDGSLTISYSHLVTLAKRTASYLAALGIRKGDRFAILMHNAPEVLIFELAGALLGATTVPLDFKRDTIDRKIFKLRDTNSKALFSTFENGGANEVPQLPKLRVISWSTFSEFQSMLAEFAPLPTKGDLNDHYVILYTSGTTAHPKGVLLSQRACLLNAMGIVDWQKFTDQDRFNIVLPLHHINSTEFCLSMLLVGGTIILNSRYSTSKFWHIVRKYRATNTSIVPTILHDLLVRHDEFVKVPSLKRICIGSAPVLPEETLRFFETFKIRVVQGYGQTETALRVAGVPVDVSKDAYKTFVTSNTIGRELANNHLAIMDEHNNEKKEGEHGEICINGPILADGYLNNPDETKKSFIDGWFHSGDLGYWKLIDGKKFFFIIGRIKEIIIKGGVNISPSAIEDAMLKAYPQIDEVSVVGYPDTRMGEEIAAVVVAKKNFTLPQQIPGLSPYETPKKIFFFDSLPKTSTGKIQRVEVKKRVAELMKKEIIKHYFVRRIDPSEVDILQKAVDINNERWLGLPSSLEEFIARTQNGLVYGAFEEKEGLVGSLSCVQVSNVDTIKTWGQATDNGTLSNHDSNGDALLCVAISVKASRSAKPVHIGSVNVNPKQYIEEYVASGKDHVLEFHKKPKGGLPGATVWKILENGRPDDKESMGYNVLMKYPEIAKGTKIVRSNAASPSVLLIEHALFYARDHDIKNVIAFSRPAEFRTYLMDKAVSRSGR